MTCQQDGSGGGNIGLPVAVDFGFAADDYGRWRQGFPAEFFARLDKLSICVAGQDVLDVGTGTGLLARISHQEAAVIAPGGIDPPGESRKA